MVYWDKEECIRSNGNMTIKRCITKEMNGWINNNVIQVNEIDMQRDREISSGGGEGEVTPAEQQKERQNRKKRKKQSEE